MWLGDSLDRLDQEVHRERSGQIFFIILVSERQVDHGANGVDAVFYRRIGGKSRVCMCCIWASWKCCKLVDDESLGAIGLKSSCWVLQVAGLLFRSRKIHSVSDRFQPFRKFLFSYVIWSARLRSGLKSLIAWSPEKQCKERKKLTERDPCCRAPDDRLALSSRVRGDLASLDPPGNLDRIRKREKKSLGSRSFSSSRRVDRSSDYLPRAPG
jgi:hypothetical protein